MLAAMASTLMKHPEPLHACRGALHGEMDPLSLTHLGPCRKRVRCAAAGARSGDDELRSQCRVGLYLSDWMSMAGVGGARVYAATLNPKSPPKP